MLQLRAGPPKKKPSVAAVVGRERAARSKKSLGRPSAASEKPSAKSVFFVRPTGIPPLPIPRVRETLRSSFHRCAMTDRSGPAPPLRDSEGVDGVSTFRARPLYRPPDISMVMVDAMRPLSERPSTTAPIDQLRPWSGRGVATAPQTVPKDGKCLDVLFNHNRYARPPEEVVPGIMQELRRKRERVEVHKHCGQFYEGVKLRIAQFSKPR